MGFSFCTVLCTVNEKIIVNLLGLFYQNLAQIVDVRIEQLTRIQTCSGKHILSLAIPYQW